MQRYASVIKVKEGMEEEYKRLHKAVWPEILELIKSCHIKNYSIYFGMAFFSTIMNTMERITTPT